MSESENQVYTKEELERMEREQRRFAMEKELEGFKEEVRKEEEKKAKRKAAWKSFKSLVYIILLVLIVLGLIVYFVHWKGDL